MKRLIAPVMLAAVTCTSVSALAQVNLYVVRVGGLDLLSQAQIDPDGPGPLPFEPNPNNQFFVGHTPTTIAYGKGNLFVGGIRNSPGDVRPLDGDDADGDLNLTEPSPFNAGLVRVGNVLTNRNFTAIRAGRAAFADTRGYTGGDYRGDIAGGQAVFTFDSGSGGTANAISVYASVDSGTPTVVNQIAGGTAYRGGPGAAFDFGPGGTGFPSIGGGPAICYLLFGDSAYFGMNPNALTASFATPVYGSATTTSIFNPANGDSVGNTLHRDVDVNPNNGDIISIGNGGVRVHTRNPDGTTTPKSYSPITTGVFPAGDFVAWQHANILHGFPGGDRIIWNFRPVTSGGQSFAGAIRANRFDTGAVETVNLLNPDGTALVFGTGAEEVNPDGTGLYDFAWEQSTQTLIILDGASRKYYILSPQQPQPCCVGAECFLLNPSNCTSAAVGGTVTGTPGSVCSPTSCEVSTACCFPNGTCQVLTSTLCASSGGVSDPATSCMPNPCPQPSNGRCCVGARCAIVAQAACVNGGGLAGASFTPAVADCNASNVFNTPCCFADYNKLGGVTVQDIFDFLADYFGSSVNANVGGDGAALPTVQDIFDFLGAYFGGGC